MRSNTKNMGKQNWQIVGHKTKQKAVEHILQMLSENTACAGINGEIALSMGKYHFSIRPKTPVKSKK